MTSSFRPVQAGPTDDPTGSELARVKAAYEDRDASAVAGQYQFANPGYAFFMQALEWSLLETFRHEPIELGRARVLDVGCGSGYILHRLLEFGAASATGVDLMPARIDAARARYPPIRFVCANAAELPFADGAFDLVTQFTCLSSVLDAGMRAAIAAEMWRVLTPGGVVLSFDMRDPSPMIRVMRHLGTWRSRRDVPAGDPATPTVPIPADELRRLFPLGRVEYQTAALAFGLCGLASRSFLAARLLASLPALREHGLAVVRKPVER